MNITRSTIWNNSSSLDSLNSLKAGGGGVYFENIGPSTITDSKFIGNVSDANGGGLHAYIRSYTGETTAPTLTVENSEFEGNIADGWHTEPGGGGIYVALAGDHTSPGSAKFDLVNTTVFNNVATNDDGGGVWVCSKYGGTFNATNSTFSGNSAPNGEGGGLWISRRHNVNDPIMVANVNHVTITNNHSPNGGGLFSHTDPKVITTLYHTIVSGNDDGSNNANNIGGSIQTGSSYNLIGWGPGTHPTGFPTGPWNIDDADNNPDLFPLGDYGGPTETHLQMPFSEVVDAGEFGFSGSPQFDQRGEDREVDITQVERPSRGPIDIGAVELTVSEFLQPPLPGPGGGTWCDIADFNYDGKVDGDDFLIWQAGFNLFPGDAAHSDGDANCDGFVNGDDFLLWQAQFVAPPGAGSGPTVDFANAVQVLDVIISGSTSTHAPFSMSAVEGSGTQLATVPVGGADAISIVFSEHANVTAGDLDIVGLYTANEPNLVTFSYDVYSSTATWTFDGWSLGDQYAITLADSVTDVTNAPAGNTLDGEWTNPAHITTVNAAVSEFPSGDGSAGGDFAFVMTLLPGDANLDNKVDGADYMIWQANNGAIEALFGDADFDGDGVVDGNDFALWQQNTGSNLEALWILADLDGDFDVDTDDVLIMIANIGGSGLTWAQGDLNGDGVIDVNDFWLWMGQNGLDIDVVA